MKKPNWKKLFHWCGNVLPFLLIAAVFLAVAFFPKPQETEAQEKRVIRIWNVDTFEGGKGSRTSFLKRAASLVEKKDKNVYYLISSYTAEGAEAAFEKGEIPDAVSFGVGLSVYTESSLPLSRSFAGGEADGGCLAYPWCRGQYFLFSLSENFDGTGSTVISCGGNNLPAVCAAIEGIEGEERDSLSAYVEFLSGKYRYLLGTQRDVCRLTSRNVTFYQKPLEGYCDLYQYFSVLSREKKEDCFTLLNTLLSPEVQGGLSSLGMYGVTGENPKSTVSAFSDGASLEKLASLARESGNGKILAKFLKNI